MAKYILEILVEGKDHASGVLDGVSGSLASLGRAGTALVLGGLAGTSAALGAAAYSGLSFNNSIEQVTAQLNAFTKDGAASAAILDMIRQRAAETPFAFEEMARATASLLPAAKQSGSKLETLVELSEILAASNPAQGLEGAAFSLREALSGDFVSIVERFNLPRQRLKELKDQGVPALEAIRIAMNEMGLDADLVSNMSRTASGRFSTLKDTLQGLAAIATKPLFDQWSAGLASFNTYLSANQPLLEGLATKIAGALGNILPALLGFVQTGVIPAVTAVADFTAGLAAAPDKLGFLASAAQGALAPFIEQSPLAKTLLADLQGGLGGLQQALQPVIAGFQEGGLGGALAALPGAIGPVSGSVFDLRQKLVGLAGEGLGQLFDKLADNQSFTAFLTNLGLSDQTVESLRGTLRNFGEIARQGAGLLIDLGTQASGLVGPLAEAGAGFGQMLAPHLQWFSDFIASTILPGLRDFANWLGPVLKGSIDIISPLVTGLVDVGLSLLELSLDSIAKLWTNVLQPAFAAMFDWLGKVGGGWDNVARGAKAVGEFFGEIAAKIREFAKYGINWDQVMAGAQQLGIPGFASGVTNFGGGLALVGERGPELVNLPPGSSVIPNPFSLPALGPGAGGGGGGTSISVGQIVIQGTSDPQATARAVREELIRMGRANGGNLFGGYA